MHETVTLMSLALTPPTIIASIAVLSIWYQSTRKALANRQKTEMHWLIIGVFIGFTGSVVDNAYWGIAWATDFVGHTSKDWLFHYGVFSNLPFRQIATLAAAYCHIRAALTSNSRILRLVLLSGWIFGTLLVFLVISKEGLN